MAKNSIFAKAYAPLSGLLSARYYPNLNTTTPERTLTYNYDLAGNLASTSDDSLQAAPLILRYVKGVQEQTTAK